MKSKTAVLAAVLALALVALVPCVAEDASAANVAYIGDNLETYEFDSRDGGSITFSIDNEGSAFTIDVTVTRSNGTVIAEETGIAIAATSVTEVTIEMSDFTSVGTYSVEVSISAPSSANLQYSSFSATIEVSQNILTNWVTWVVVVIIVIVIAILVYMKYRDAPKKESTMTFEELEEQRKIDMAAKSEKK